MALKTGIFIKWLHIRKLTYACLVMSAMGLLYLASKSMKTHTNVVKSSWIYLPMSSRYATHEMNTTNLTTTRNISANSNIVLLNITAPNDTRPLSTHSKANTSSCVDVLRKTAKVPPGDLLTYVTDLFRQRWKHNPQNSNCFKLKFQEKINMSTYNDIMIRRNNVKAMKKFNETHTVFQHFPQETPLPRLPYNSCSIVGNSGILLGSQCGNEIDKADMVFRFNLAPTWDFEADVGSKTNITSMNPSIPRFHFGNLRFSKYTEKFSRWMSRQNGLVTSRDTWKIVTKAMEIAKTANSNLTFGFVNMDHFRAVGRFWRQYGDIGKMTSTGFYFISSALDLCTHVNVFGFWPFNVTADGRKARYHYFDKIKPTPRHNMSTEFRAIIGMHESGLLRLHVGNCTDMP